MDTSGTTRKSFFCEWELFFPFLILDWDKQEGKKTVVKRRE